MIAEAPPPPPMPVIVPPVTSRLPPIGFRNGAAVRAGLIAGISGFILLILSGQLRLPAVTFLSLVAAGFWAVFLYERRTGEKLSMLHGAHLGWISGIFGFALTAVMLGALVAALSDPAVLEAMRQQLRGATIGDAQIDQMINVIHDPSLLLMSIVVTFLLFTVLPACGGALGAKLLDRDRRLP